MPAEATGEIEIWAGHASTYGAISVTDKFVLRAARGRSTSSRFGGSFAGAFGASLTVLVAAAASWRRTRGCSGRLALGHAGERFGSKQVNHSPPPPPPPPDPFPPPP